MTEITIPREALEAAAQEMAPHPWSMYTDAAKDHFRHKARTALLAGLKAWPGMTERFFPNDPTRPPGVFLPLKQEDSNAEG